jgi:hypothetical protein
VESVHFTIKGASSNPAHGEVYSIQYYVVKFVNSAIFQLYHGENKLIFNEMMTKSDLQLTNTLSWIFYSASSLKQRSTGRHVALLGHIILILSKPVFAVFLIAACLTEKQQIPIVCSFV